MRYKQKLQLCPQARFSNILISSGALVGVHMYLHKSVWPGVPWSTVIQKEIKIKSSVLFIIACIINFVLRWFKTDM